MAKNDGNGKEKRFIKTYSDNSFATETAVLVDRATGVNYLWYAHGEAGGLCPLLDRDGKPVVTYPHDFDEK